VVKTRLGRGLGALLPEAEMETESGKTGKSLGAGGKGLPQSGETGFPAREAFISLDKLTANPGQPRKYFDKTELEELAASIKQHGIIQPIIVDEDKNGNYVIVAGERRSRAARLAGLQEVPVILRKYSGQKRLEVALVENIHRSDLNPIEEASAYKQLMENAGLSQDEAAERVGKNRSTVANALRLLKLPLPMREALETGSLSAGHARTILSLTRPADQEKLFAEITAKGLSVRAAEQRAAGMGSKSAGKNETASGKKSGKDHREPELKAMEERLIEALGTKVSINGNFKKGRIEIEYYSMDDLDRLYGLMSR
jgi:ParB family chromosome partitioning protein